MSDGVLFGSVPYWAVASAVAVPWLRCAPRAGRSALVRDLARGRRLVRGTGATWGVALLALALGHVAGVLVPSEVLAWNRSPTRLYVLEAAGAVAGVMVLAGQVRMVVRQFATPVRGAGSLVVTAALGLGLAAAASGLAVAGLYRWGSSWGAVTLAPYLASVLRLDPQVDLVARLPALAKLHVLSSFALLGVLPLTPAGAWLALAVRGGLGRLGRPLRGTLRGLRRSASAMLRRRIRALSLWREDQT